MSKQDVIDYVMETPHNTNRAVLEGLVDTAVEESQVQADWNQNDETAKDYIKNRICYEEEETVTELGNTYAVWDELTAADRYTPISYKMNGTIYKDVVPTYNPSVGAYLYNSVAPYDHYIGVLTQNSSIDSGGVNFQFVKIENAVKQIDKKYIPDEAFTQANWNENNEASPAYIKNRICYEETVPDTYEELQLTTSNWKSLTGYVKGSDLSKMLSIPLNFIVNGVKHYNVSPEWYFESKTEITYFFNESKTLYVSVTENDIDINGVSLGQYPSSSNILFLKIIKHENLVKQIDSKYIPIDSIPTEGSTNAASSDALAKLESDIDGFFDALPEFVVAVTLDQSKIFTDNQKQIARNNIGAISSSELVQSDWNQNDPTAKDYVKNRICYAEDGTIDVYYDSANHKLSVRSINLQLGATYNVKTSTNVSVIPSGNGTDYVCKKVTDVISELSSVPEYENVLCIGGWNSETHRPDPFLVTNQPDIFSDTVRRYLITGSNLKINALPMKYYPTDLSLFKVVTYDSENNRYTYVNKDVEFLQPTIATDFRAGNKRVGDKDVIYTGMPAYNNDGMSPFRVESDIIPYIDIDCTFNLSGNNLPDITLDKSISYNQSNLSGIKNAEALKIFQQKYAKIHQNSVIIRGIMIFKDVTLTGYCTLDNDSTDDKPKISFFDSYKGKIYKCSFTADGDTQTLVEIQNIWDSTIISSSDVLTKTNTTAFTPTADYHPATKKYVDDHTPSKISKLENDSNYITAAHVYDGILISSSTPNSTKKFKITVDDTGALTATGVTEA